ncbi:MAG: MFS transporter, partial [Oscillospiraceae bacterium]
FCFFLAKAPSALFATQLIHPVGYAVFILSSIYYVDHILPGPDKIKGHAFMTATTTGGAISGSLLGGFFIDRFDISTMLAIGCCIGIVGIAVVFLSFYLPLKNRPSKTDA